jgi:DHA2 family multidrug resistance protein
VDATGETARTLAASGLGPEAVRESLDRLAQSQSVMLATNGMMGLVAASFLLAALVIWLAPRPTRAIDMAQAGH